MLTQEQRKALLRIARESVEAAVRNQQYRPQIDDPELRKPGAAFVTLKEHGDLRGCIGTIEAHEPLFLNVANMARASTLEDYRFPQVRPVEVPGLTIEISVMTPSQPVALYTGCRANVAAVTTSAPMASRRLAHWATSGAKVIVPVASASNQPSTLAGIAR